MTPKRKITGSLLATVGYLLSPLSWWNDAFVNLPLALVFAWLVSAPAPPPLRERIFQIAAVFGYWLTNVLGFVLMHRGARILFAADTRRGARRELARDLAVSVGYTVLILILIKLGVLKPLHLY